MAAQGLSIPTPAMSVGGIMPIMGNRALDEMKKRSAPPMPAAQQQAIAGLAAHVRSCWAVAEDHKRQYVETRLMNNLRRRNGEYSSEVLAAISEQGGSRIYMMLVAAKCRAASAWLREALMGTGNEKPWTLEPTQVPEMSPDVIESIMQEAQQQIAQYMQASNGISPPDESVRTMLLDMKAQTEDTMRAEAVRRCELMEKKMEDQLVEGGWISQIQQFIDDICTFPFAVMKGPIVRMRPSLKWVQGPKGYTPQVTTSPTLEWQRVSPFDVYWAPYAVNIDDSYLIERHRMTRTELNALIGVPGFQDKAIREVLDIYGQGGLREWLANDAERSHIEGKGPDANWRGPETTIDALEFHGSVQGKMLLEWGMSAKEVKDPDMDYSCCVWLIGDKVLKAQLNYDPLGRKPYYKTSFEKIPGQWMGNSIPDLAADCEDMCNAAARALANNMGISSGPQVAVNVQRLPDGEDITQMYPWKVWQFTSDPNGSTAKAIDFFSPTTMAPELMAVYEKFSVLADESTGIPRYMQGDSNIGTLGRTASGVSMVMGNASKIIKQVISNIDIDVTEPGLEYQYYYNMRYLDDPDLKGDIKIKARGAISIMQKEQSQLRQNELLQMALSNPVAGNLIGPKGIANMMREVFANADFTNMDKIIPSPEAVERMQAIAQQQQQAEQAQQLAAAQQPAASMNIKRDANGQVTGMDVMPQQPGVPAPTATPPGQPPIGGNKLLPTGGPQANGFAPVGGA